MLSKSTTRATALVLALLAGSCARLLPWRGQDANEVNLAFTLRENLVELQTLRVNDRAGRFILGTAAPRTVLDPRYASTGTYVLQISDKTTIKLTPATFDLRGAADGIIGADAWNRRAISIDYRSGLVTYQTNGIETSQMTTYRFQAAPTIDVLVNGTRISAIVDTTSPDTLVLPGADARATARVQVAGTDFGAIDVRYANVSQARIGNRLLSRFLVSIDYGRGVVGLWRDPRI